MPGSLRQLSARRNSSAIDESEASLAQPTYRSPSRTLLERLSTDQRSSFLETSNRVPSDFGSCSLLPFDISVPPNSSSVASRPYCIKTPTAKQEDAVLDKFLAAGLIQHSTSPWASPVFVIPKTLCGIHITVNYKKLNKLSILGQLPIPRFDESQDKLCTGPLLSLFDLVSSFHQITVHKDTTPLTAFCTPTLLRVAGHATRKQRCFRVVRQGHHRGHQRPRPRLCLPRGRTRLRRQPLPPRRYYEGSSSRACEHTTSTFPLQKFPSAPRMQISSVTPPLSPASCRTQKRWKR